MDRLGDAICYGKTYELMTSFDLGFTSFCWLWFGWRILFWCGFEGWGWGMRMFWLVSWLLGGGWGMRDEGFSIGKDADAGDDAGDDDDER